MAACSGGNEGWTGPDTRFVPVFEWGVDTSTGYDVTTSVGDYRLLRAKDGTHHVFASYEMTNPVSPIPVTYGTAHRASEDGATFTDRTGCEFADEVAGQVAPMLGAIESDAQGNLIVARRDTLAFWDKATQAGRRVGFPGGFGTMPSAPERLVKVGDAAWETGRYWVVSPTFTGPSRHLIGLDFAASRYANDHFASTQAFAFEADGAVDALFFNSAALADAPRDVTPWWTQGDPTHVHYARPDRQSILYRYRKSAPLADGSLEVVDLKSLDLLRDGFGRDHVQTWFRVLAAAHEADGTLVAVFSVNDRLAFFASVEETAQGPRLSAPVFLDGEFLSLDAFPDTGQPVVFVRGASELLAYPVSAHALGEVWAVDIHEDASAYLERVQAAHLAAEPGRGVSLLVVREAATLCFLRTGLVRRGTLLAGGLSATATAWHSPARVELTAPAGASSYEWCPEGPESCVSAGKAFTHTYATDGAQAYHLVVVRAAGDGGVGSVFARMVEVLPGNAVAHLEAVATYELDPAWLVGPDDGTHFFALDATDPYDLSFLVMDLATGQELGRTKIGYGLGTPVGLLPVGDRVYVMYASRWMLMEVSDPAHPVAVEALQPPGEYPSARLCPDGLMLFSGNNSVFAFDPAQDRIAWGPVGLAHDSISALGDELYLVSWYGVTTVRRREGDTFVETYRLTEADAPSFTIFPGPGDAPPLLFVRVAESSTTLQEATFPSGGAPVLGPPTTLPFAVEARRGFQYEGLVVFQQTEGGLLLVDRATGAHGSLALEDVTLWTDAPWLNPWSLRRNPIRPDGTLFVEYTEYGTIDRYALTPDSLENDVLAEFGRKRVRVFKLER